MVNWAHPGPPCLTALPTVLQDWAIFKTSWQQMFIQKKPKHLVTLCAAFKTLLFKYKLLWQRCVGI